MIAEKWYLYIFEDGYRVCVRGMRYKHIKVVERKHGKLVSKLQQ